MDFFTSISEGLKFLNRVMDLIAKTGAVVEKQKLQDWLNGVEEGINMAEKATTVEERRAAARKLVDSIRSIGG